MARYHGKNGRLYLSTTGTGTASPVASLRQWSLDMTAERTNATALGDANIVRLQGLPDVNGRFTGLFDDTTINTLYTAARSSDGVKIYLYPSTQLGFYFYGPAWIDLSVETPFGDNVSVSGSFVANGDWGAKLS